MATPDRLREARQAMQKLIIDARLNEYTMRDANPHVPWSPAEIGEAAAACRDAGASVVHYHARDPETGAPSNDAALYAAAAREIRSRCDALVMPTLGANTVTDLDARIGHIEAMAKDDATRADLFPLDLASVTLAMWQEGADHVGGGELVYHNSVATLEALAARGQAAGARPMAAIWSIASLRLLEALCRTGTLPATIFAELFTTEGGLIAGHPGTPAGLQALIDFVPDSVDVVWAAAGYGANALALAEQAIAQGGHVAIGLGDHAYPELGDGRPTNADVVAAVARIAKRHGREIATPDEVRERLGCA